MENGICAILHFEQSHRRREGHDSIVPKEGDGGFSCVAHLRGTSKLAPLPMFNANPTVAAQPVASSLQA